MNRLIPLLVFLFPLAYSPGPGNAFFAVLGAARGLRGCWSALAGYHIATLLVTLAVGFGLSGVQALGPGVVVALRAIGAVYMIWLALLLAKAGTARIDAALPTRSGIVAGALLLLFNPKAWVILSLLFSQFPAGNTLSLLAITLIFTLNNLVAFILWALLGVGLARLFHNPASARLLNMLFAAALFITVLGMLGHVV